MRGRGESRRTSRRWWDRRVSGVTNRSGGRGIGILVGMGELSSSN